MIDIRPRESVLFADNFSAQVLWYQEVLGFKQIRLFEEDYHYCNLESASGIKLGITSAKEMGIHPVNRASNSIVLQFEVDDVVKFFEHIIQNGGSVLFGPSFDKKGSFWFGGFADPEGNPFWIVDKNCP